MKIQLPNGEKTVLDEGLRIEEKIEVTRKLTEEWSDEIVENWNSNSIKYFLDGLSNYLVWHKEAEDKEKKTEDKYVMSKKKIEKLIRHKKTSKQIIFSDLPKDYKEILLGE